MNDGENDLPDELIEQRQGYIEALEHELREKEQEIQQLREELNQDKSKKRDRRGPGGTPNMSGKVEERLSEGRPPKAAFEELDEEDKVLHRVLRDGPDEFTGDETPVYPVHERTYQVLLKAPMLARETSHDGSTLHLTTPTVKQFLQTQFQERMKHTQVRRVFEQIEDAGSEYPRPPILHKNRDGVVELVIFDYDQIAGVPQM